MKKYILISSVILLTSCDITKSATKSKKDIQTTETEKIRRINKGGFIETDILPESERPRDTVVVVNKDEITKTIYYKPNGVVTVKTECPDTYEDIERQKETLDKSKDKESEKEENFDSKVILYGMLGLAVIVLGALFIGLNFLGKQTKATNTLLSAVAEKLK